MANGTAGIFAAASDIAVAKPSVVRVGDFNGDNIDDIAVANYDSDVATVILNNSAGSFASPVSFNVGDRPTYIAVGDFNEDNVDDLVTTNVFSSDVSLLLSNAQGIFTPATSFSVGSPYPRGLAMGDFNGDNNLDVAVVSRVTGTGKFIVLEGNGSGIFSSPINLAAGVSLIS